MTTLPEKELLRPDEVAEYFRVSTRTVYGWISTGKEGEALQAVKIGGTVRIPRQAVINFQRAVD